MSSDELKALLQRPAVSKRNPNIIDVSNPHRAARQIAKLEPAFGDVALGAPPLPQAGQERFRVRIYSARKRLLDEDNTMEKYVVDELRYAGFIPNDNPARTSISVEQRKCEKGEDEHVEIIIDQL